MGYKEIREITGLTKSTVSKICREYKLTMNRTFSEITISNDNKSKIKKAYDEVKSTRKVAKLLNISRDSVIKVISNKRKKQISNNVISWRKRSKLKLVEYKGGECERCGYNKCIDSLEFHHIDPNEKDFTISGKSFNVQVKPGTQPDTTLRISGQGLPYMDEQGNGDQLILLKPFIPDRIDPKITASILQSRGN